MTWAFRVDTNKNAGGGHTSRSICLTNQINKHKKVVFFVNCKNDKLSTKIIDSGYKVDVVDNFDQYNFEHPQNYSFFPSSYLQEHKKDEVK